MCHFDVNISDDKIALTMRGKEIYCVKQDMKTERMRKSAVVSIQKLLNKDVSKREILRKLVIIC